MQEYRLLIIEWLTTSDGRVNLIDQIDIIINHNKTNAEWSSNRTPANYFLTYVYVSHLYVSHFILGVRRVI